jgi:hypothetical protein
MAKKDQNYTLYSSSQKIHLFKYKYNLTSLLRLSAWSAPSAGSFTPKFKTYHNITCSSVQTETLCEMQASSSCKYALKLTQRVFQYLVTWAIYTALDKEETVNGHTDARKKRVWEVVWCRAVDHINISTTKKLYRVYKDYQPTVHV